MITRQVWSYTLTAGTIVIDGNFELNTISVLASSGTVTIECTLTSGGVASAPVTLAEGQAVTINAGNDNTLPLTGITITTAGTASIIGR